MRIAVIGLGSMGSNHARILKEFGVLSAICDTDANKLINQSKQYGVPFYTHLDDLLSTEKDLDAVCIAAPTAFHLPITQECTNYNLNIFLEKPLASTLEEAEQLVELVDNSNKLFSVGYIERYNPAFKALQKLITEEEFGDITSVNIKRVGGIPRSANNIILDLMTHDINLLLALFKKSPTYISTNKRIKNNIIDSAQTLFCFGEASATCESNWICPTKIRRIELTGTSGYCEVNLIRQEIIRYKNNKITNEDISFKDFDSYKHFVSKYGEPYCQIIDKFYQEPLKEELRAFIDAIKTRSNVQLVSGKDALDTLKITLEACNERRKYDNE
jgi:UDP-N-acetylglucosamine 3-dehydrogenase